MHLKKFTSLELNHQHSNTNARGFSLVELSIVLVILGLLVGGVLTGKSLIRASELRTITKEYNSYKTATLSFRDKYFQLPGDMNNATKFWGVAAAGVPCANAAVSGTKTCDGNGDGRLMYTVTGTSGTLTKEDNRFWQHLTNAQLLEGGQVTAGGGTFQATGRMGTWTTGTLDSVSGGTGATTTGNTITIGSVGLSLFDGEYGNVLFLNTNSTILGEELWNIDTKIDDGKPSTGIFVVATYAPTDCTDATNYTTLTGKYVMASDACLPLFRKVF